MRYTDGMQQTPPPPTPVQQADARKIHVSDTEAYDLFDSIVEIQDRFRGEQWHDCEDAVCEHARREARDIAELDGLSPEVQDEIEARLHAAARQVAR